MAIARTPIIDDDGSGETGTALDFLWKDELYDQIDAAIGSVAFVDVAQYGGVADGVTNNDGAIAAAYAALVAQYSPAVGGILFFGPGTWLYNTGFTVSDDHVTIKGAGRGATTLRCASGVFSLKVSGDHVSLEDFTLYYTGAVAVGVYASNATTDPTTAVMKLSLRRLWIQGADGTSHGLWLVNAQHGTVDDLYMPGGGGTGGGNAILAEGIGFWHWANLDITPNLGDGGGVQWVNGLELTVQAGNLTFACDDNKFYDLRIEGVSGKAIYQHGVIASGPAAGSAPADNSFFGGVLEGNGTNISLASGWTTSFWAYHWETATTQAEITDSTVWAAFYHCLGSIRIHEPASATNVKNTLLVGHAGDITIDGKKVINTTIINPNETSVITDGGEWTTLIGRATMTGAKIASSAGPGPMRASANAVQGSGGAAVTITALPGGSAGYITVLCQQNGSVNCTAYQVGFVNVTGIAIGTPIVVATAGGTSGTLTFTLSGSNLQAKGNNATAPDYVWVLEQISWSLPA